MSERILKALMQLFAIIAKVEVDENGELNFKKNSKERSIVELFLKQELNPEQVKSYLKRYDDFLLQHHNSKKRKDGKQKRTSVNSVKILRICAQINSELTQKQRIIVLVRILEFIYVKKNPTEQDIEFARTVSDSFNIDEEEFESIFNFIRSDKKSVASSQDLNLLLISSERPESAYRFLQAEGIEGEIWVLRISSVNFHFFKYLGKDEIYLNGQLISNDRHHILNQGSSIRSNRMQTIYYSDILSVLLSDENHEKFVFKADNVVYRFSRNSYGVRDLNLEEESGKLIGIMGASGSGKSTLLNILNGNLAPTKGFVSINGIDIHNEKDKIRGVIGYVSQDDLLIEELTVFQNLYFNAQLSFGKTNKRLIARKVLSLLTVLGLYEVKDLKVGSPLEKTISGGQRKRLNIALELIREPAVLFVDEPTSGLSSRDSENIMDLLKELTLKGKLVFVVIHQPSSDIFKMFDQLLIMDQGGYPIYQGNPVDAVIYFKEAIDHANSQESECRTCGNVNPEQIFNIIESRVVDEYGNQTPVRKTPPESWYKLYKEHLSENKSQQETTPETTAPKSQFEIPGKWKQFLLFYKRDILAKLTNRQYVLINLLEAPVLALILAFFVKFFAGESYSFEKNSNIPQYLFISVIIALFIGLTVAAEEIIKDRKIKKRETFLNLSRGSYLFSKISILFGISAIQALLFVLVGNSILEIKGLWLPYWFTFFTVACFANLAGLNISAGFNSAKVIYILIPLIIIPQLLFSGAIVKFDKLHPVFGKESGVPCIGNLMASRWGYEALAVVQFKNNTFQQLTYELEKQKSFHEWKRDFYIPELIRITDQVILKGTISSSDSSLFSKELQHELSNWSDILSNEALELTTLSAEAKKTANLYKTKQLLTDIKNYHNLQLRNINRQLDSVVMSYPSDQYAKIKSTYFNTALYDLMTNRDELDKLVLKNGAIIQKHDPVFRDSDAAFFSAHFFAPRKQIAGRTVSTFGANMVVIWFMTIILFITLYYNLLRRLIVSGNRLRKTVSLRKRA